MSVSAFAQNLEDSFIAKEACGDDVAAFVENAPFRRISLKPPAICPQKSSRPRSCMRRLSACRLGGATCGSPATTGRNAAAPTAGTWCNRDCSPDCQVRPLAHRSRSGRVRTATPSDTGDVSSNPSSSAASKRRRPVSFLAVSRLSRFVLGASLMFRPPLGSQTALRVHTLTRVRILGAPIPGYLQSLSPTTGARSTR